MTKSFHKVALITAITSLLVSSLLSNTAGAAVPGSFIASYVISDNKPVSNRSLVFKTQGKRYTMTATTKATGMLAMLNPDPIVEHSQGVITKNEVAPSHYTRSNPNNKKKNLDLTFDWKKGEVLSKTSPTDISYKISAHTHDMLSDTLFLMFTPPATIAKLDIATRSRPKFYTLKRLGEENIKTAAGTFKTVKYQRTRNGKIDRAVYIWCAAKLSNLPVKIEKHKKGKVHTAELQSFKGL
jgi:hypothetical protein